ncbi:MAG: hypothetical protein M1816_002113 [Peltula sp. TS41687]|nr:MAG: hypothetical protein M1816_002113 [Peltula sp. TS41687]
MERPRPISSPLSSIIDDYTAKPLPPLPLAYSRSSSIYSQDSSSFEQQQQQQQNKPSDEQPYKEGIFPEQIYLQPTRFYSSTSELPLPKPTALYEQPQHSSTLSLRLKPKLLHQEANHTVLHRAASYSKSKRERHGRSEQYLGLRDRPRARLLPVPVVAGAQVGGGSDDDRPLSRFSADSDDEKDGDDARSKGKVSVLSYLSQLSIPRSERRALKSRSRSNLTTTTTQPSSNRSSAVGPLSVASSSFLFRRSHQGLVGLGAAGNTNTEMGTTTTHKSFSNWPRKFSLTSLLHAAGARRESTTAGIGGGRFVLPTLNNRARKQSSSSSGGLIDTTPHVGGGGGGGYEAIDGGRARSQSQSLAAGALASIQRGTWKLRGGMDRARRKVTEGKTERRKLELKRQIRVVGEVDLQVPTTTTTTDGRGVGWWI